MYKIKKLCVAVGHNLDFILTNPTNRPGSGTFVVVRFHVWFHMKRGKSRKI